MMCTHNASKLIVSCMVAATMLTIGAAGSFAQSKGVDSALTTQIMNQRKAAMKDREMMKMMGTQNMRMMVMDQMAHQMATDPAFQKMHAEMMSDPESMKMMKECKAMMADSAQIKKVQDEIMKDPKAMDVVASKAMMMDMARTDPEMMKMMNSGTMKH